MKVRLAALAVALALAVSAIPAVAQQPGPPPGGMGGPGGAGRRMTALMNGITLTAPQQARVDSIQASIRAQMPQRTPGQAPDSTAMQLRRVLSARQDSLVRSLLTPEQQATWDRNLQNMPQGMPPRPPGQ